VPIGVGTLGDGRVSATLGGVWLRLIGAVTAAPTRRITTRRTPSDRPSPNARRVQGVPISALAAETSTAALRSARDPDQVSQLMPPSGPRSCLPWRRSRRHRPSSCSHDVRRFPRRGDCRCRPPAGPLDQDSSSLSTLTSRRGRLGASATNAKTSSRGRKMKTATGTCVSSPDPANVPSNPMLALQTEQTRAWARPGPEQREAVIRCSESELRRAPRPGARSRSAGSRSAGRRARSCGRSSVLRRRRRRGCAPRSTGA
jgi:hypothetical protein